MITTRAIKISLVIVVMLATAGVASALADANTVPDTFAGDGAGDISGYVVSNIRYHLSPSNPGNIASVTFTLDAAADDVVIELDGATYDCTVAGTSVDCTTTGATVVGATSLRVIAGNIVP
jgi:hypothetical protein